MRATQLGVMVFTRQFHWAKAPGICIRPNRGKANAPHIARIIAPVAVRRETRSKTNQSDSYAARTAEASP